MRLALVAAAAALDQGEAPIGAVVVAANQVISTAGNRRETTADPAGHAEFLAIRDAASRLGRWRLNDCTVYVTLEPCLMCAGLMLQARIARCVYAAKDPKAGALGSLYELHEDNRLNHNFAVSSGILADQSVALLNDFFQVLRLADRSNRQQAESNRQQAE